jgi:hypothetical protein
MEIGASILNSDEKTRPARILLWNRNNRVEQKPSA